MSTLLSTFDLKAWEMYRGELADTLVSPLEQSSAHLESACTVVKASGEYKEMDTIGAFTLKQREKMYEDKDPQEMNFGKRRYHDIAFAGAVRISRDVLTHKGGFPIFAERMQTGLYNAARPIPDRVILGVMKSKDAGITTLGENCVLPSNVSESTISLAATDGSIYKGSGYPGATSASAGMPQGIMGPNQTGMRGETIEHLPQQPVLSDATSSILASGYNAYKSDISKLDARLTNVVTYNYTETGTPSPSDMTLAKLMFARLCFAERNALSDDLCAAITPRQAMSLLMSKETNSSDWGFHWLRDSNGKWLESALGIRFLVTPDVPLVNIGTAASPVWVRSCPVWRKQDIEFGIWDSVQADIVSYDHKYDEIVASIQCAFGAGRLRPETVISIHCVEPGLARYNGEVSM